MQRLRFASLAICSLLAACTGSMGNEGPAGPEGPDGSAGATGPQGPAGSNSEGPAIVGAVYVASNDPAHNEVWAFARRADGSLVDPWAFSTGGAGTGASLSDQGSVFLDAATKQVFVVNAGTNTIAMLAIQADGSLALAGTPAPSGGVNPVSVTEHGGIVYVLNAGDPSHAPNVAGFTVGATGLASNSVSLALSTASSATAAVAQLSFTPDGNHLVATEKGTGEIDTYEVDASGVATGPHSQLSAGGAASTPYGFAFDTSDTLLVTEAAGAVSAYKVSDTGELTATTTSASTHQAAPCWMAAGNGWGWAINAGGDSVTGYSVAGDGTIALTAPTGVAAGTANKPLDAALSSDGAFLYVLDSTDHAISNYEVGASGALTRLPDFLGLPAAAEGIAAN
ncbi:MAG TPA: beta-propeller fold lactonase family protein [Kofleriaceae bacterium]|jgi:6-phosphogluconolactonase (cycloisomerase 2 family)